MLKAIKSLKTKIPPNTTLLIYILKMWKIEGKIMKPGGLNDRIQERNKSRGDDIFKKERM